MCLITPGSVCVCVSGCVGLMVEVSGTLKFRKYIEVIGLASTLRGQPLELGLYSSVFVGLVGLELFIRLTLKLQRSICLPLPSNVL